MQHLLTVEKPEGGLGVPHVDGKQHRGSLLFGSVTLRTIGELLDSQCYHKFHEYLGRAAMTDKTTRILLVDDEESITDFVGYALRKEGFVVDIAATGTEAATLDAQESYDLFILDIMLPGIDGYELCRRIRTHSQAPILFLSARDKELDKVIGLEIGGDDYLTKPFGVRELLARIHALLRRSNQEGHQAASSSITVAGITLDEDAHRAMGENGPIHLTPREFELLAYLMRNADKVLGREELLREAWGWEYLTESKTVDTHIKRLRDKLAEAGCDPQLVETVRGYGYRFRA